MTFSFVPDEGPIPNEDYWGHLLSADRYGVGLRPRIHQDDLDSLLAPAAKWPESWWRQVRGRPYVVGLFVDLNRVSADQVEAAIKRIRSGPHKNVKARVIFRFARWTTVVAAP